MGKGKGNNAFDDTFETTDSGASLTIPQQMSAFRKGQYIMIKDRPCRILDMSTCKTGKHGSAKVHVTAFDIFTDKKCEDLSPSTSNRDMPIVKRVEYQLLDIDTEEGYVTVMTDKGEVKDDVLMPAGELYGDLIARFEKEESLMVTVMSACNEEKIVAVKTMTK